MSLMVDIGQVLFFCILMDWDKVEVNNNAKEKRIETMPMSSGPERTNLVNKRFLYGQETFSLMNVLQLICFLLFLGMVMYANRFLTKEKQESTAEDPNRAV